MYEPSLSDQLHDFDLARVRSYRVLVAVFLLISAALGLDIIDDISHGAALRHVLLEIAVVLVSLSGVLLLTRSLLAARRKNRTLHDETTALRVRLAATERDAQHFRAEHAALLQGLGAAMDAQFAHWQLSNAEREVALLLLKGLSHREIASARGTSEPTVRQQAQSVYRKAGVTGRADLAAFFLEDLLLPSHPSTST